MLSYIFSGIILGLTAGVSPGPLLVLVISESITHGTRAGVKTALAPLITDTPIIILSFFILKQLQDFKLVLAILSICGAFYILFLAYEGWKSGPIESTDITKKSNGLIKGFYANMLNPHPYVFWLMVGTPLIIKGAHISFMTAAMFLFFFYFCIIGAKMAVAILVGRYRERFNQYYVVIQRVLSFVLVILSILFFYEGIKYFI